MALGALNDNAWYAYDYFQKKYGYTPAQSAGIVGNLMQESTMMTNARNKGDGSNGSDSIGVGQWNGDRSKAFYNFANANKADPNSLDTQLDFVHNELGSAESASGKRLSNATDVGSATAAMIGYERPQGYSVKNPQNGNGWDNRLAWANNLLSGDRSGSTSAPVGTLGPLSSPSSNETQNAVVAQAPAAATTVPQGTQIANPEAGQPYHDGAIAWFQNHILGQPAAAQPATVAAGADGAATDASRGLSEKLGFGAMPKSIMGVNVNKAAKAMGAYADAVAQQDAATNQQLQSVAQQGEARARAAQPVQIQAQATPTFNTSASANNLSPDQLKKLQALIAMQKAGGLGGFGGIA